MTKQLIDRDEVHKILKQNYGNYYEVAKALDSLPIQQSNELNHPTIISGGFQPDGWIDVNDRLPGTESFIATDGIDVGEAIYRDGLFLWGDEYHYQCTCTHWQPLPTPPITNN